MHIEILNKPYVLLWHNTGSRYICDPAPTDTDNDIIVLIKSGYFFDLMMDADDAGYEIGGSEIDLVEFYQVNSDEGFQSLKKDDINLIITESIDFYTRFVSATMLAKEQNLLNKQDRIKLFQRALYGNTI
jgi:tmRNA-binding protein